MERYNEHPRTTEQKTPKNSKTEIQKPNKKGVKHFYIPYKLLKIASQP